MDIIIKTLNYSFSLDGLQMFAIDKYLMDKLNTVGNTGKVVYITRKEVKGLADYIKNHAEIFGNYIEIQELLYDRVYNMWLLMGTKEKMEIRWW